MTGGLQALGQSMYDAIGGRAPETVALFNQLGIAFDDGTRHARSVSAVLPEVANRIAAIKDPFTQARVAVQLFGSSGEQMLPFLRRGAAGIADLQERTLRFGVTTTAGVAAANRMREAQADLTLAVQGLGNSIAEQLGPIISPLLDQMANWIAANRAWISTGIGARVKEFATYVQSIDFTAVLGNIQGLWHQADGVAQSFGGWKTVLEAVVAVKLASWLLPVAANILTVVSAVRTLMISMPLLSAALAAAGATYLAYTRTKQAYDEYLERKAANEAALATTEANPDKQAHFDQLGAAHQLPPALQQHYDDTHRINGRRGGPDAYALGTATTARGPIDLSAYRQSTYRNNNPTNLAYYPGQPGVQGANGRWGVYQTPEAGAAAGLHQMILDQGRGFNTLRAEITRRSPPGENNTAGMIGNISQWSGLDPDAPMDLRNPDVARRFLSADIRQEQGHAPDSGLVDRAVALADGAPGLPGQGGASGKVDVHLTVSGAGVQSVVTRTTGNVNPPKVASTSVGAGNGGV
jgi:hypothetical protein